MGFLERLSSLQRTATAAPPQDTLEGAYSTGVIPYASPYPPHMPTIQLAATLFEGFPGFIGRDAARQLPPLSKGRNALQLIATLPLKALRKDELIDPQPRWLVASGYGSPWLRMTATIDDLLYDGAALWHVDRGARDAILDAAHVDRDEWTITPDNVIQVQGEDAKAGEVILFSGPIPGGVLSSARNTIQAGLDLENVWAGRVASPAPLIELHMTTDDEVTPEEKDSILAAWNTARRSRTGATAWTPSWLQVIEHGQAMTDLLVAGRNQVAVDLASHLGLPTAATNSSLATASLTYVTQESMGSQLREALVPWRTAIEARLSEDDVTPMGQRIAFDVSRFDLPQGSEEES